MRRLRPETRKAAGGGLFRRRTASRTCGGWGCRPFTGFRILGLWGFGLGGSGFMDLGLRNCRVWGSSLGL